MAEGEYPKEEESTETVFRERADELFLSLFPGVNRQVV